MAALRTTLFLFAAVCLALGTQAARAAELVMFEKDGCPWCARWHTEIGAGYPHSDEGKRAPLRVVKSADESATGIALRGPVTLSPTFVLVDKGQEIGRIVGYPGAEFFYGLLAPLLQKLDKAAALRSNGRAVATQKTSRT